ELYLSRAAEVASVRRDVLEREIGVGGGGMGDAGRVPTHPPSPIPHPSLPTSAEKALLLLLLEGDPWRAKVLEAVDAEEFEFPAYRAVFEAARATLRIGSTRPPRGRTRSSRRRGWPATNPTRCSSGR